MRFFLIFHCLLIFGVSCNFLKEDSKNDRVGAAALLLSADDTSSCAEFSSSESICTLNPEDSSITCSDAELTRLQQFINPQASRNRDSMESFFACWARCNLVFNNQEPTCGGSKFNNTTDYRKSQRSFSSVPSRNWGNCMDKCNGGGSTEGGIQGVTFTGYGY